ncbi:hypothetical protein [Flavobacterium dankookense]|uniref:Uncharacterized protein n=1 Tax=Flavobacterium dankookense TaxID=706186 RepID=A0A4R6Q7A8_9FLAO|nr:hypothetical protein [Flavobacterium dankookense]TDP57950.1 hypothetical protein BC748_2462 [Flavobacterium dankookense]
MLPIILIGIYNYLYFLFKLKFKNKFIFPYSNDYELRENQIWKNLAYGLLIENKKQFLIWEMPFSLLSNYTKKEKSGDRTTWYFNNNKILNGFELNIQIVKWNIEPFKKFEFIEYTINKETADKLIKHLSENIGNPEINSININSDDYYIGKCEWEKFDIKIKILTAEFQGGFAYKIQIGKKHAVDMYY